MEKEFIPYELALRMKALGFNENCYRVGNPNGAIVWRFMDVAGVEGVGIDDILQVEFDERWVQIPTFSQAFRWFRENHNLHAEPYTVDMGAIEYCFQIRDLYSEKYIYDNFVGAGGSYHGTFDTPEEAELACLEKLIEIVEQKEK